METPRYHGQETTGGKFPAGAGAGAGIVQNWPGPGIGRSENMAGAGAGAGAGAVNFSDASCFMMLNLYCSLTGLVFGANFSSISFLRSA